MTVRDISAPQPNPAAQQTLSAEQEHAMQRRLAAEQAARLRAWQDAWMHADAAALGVQVPTGNGDPGGTYSARGVDPFVSASGEQTVVRALQDTGNDKQIQNDEFEIVKLDNGKYIVVLPGVIDLSSPNLGLDDFNRSVRDTDQSALRSSTSARIRDNPYAVMVERYMRAHVPQGADVMIVGHSFGADTALDLASDAVFNNKQTGFNITHVTAAAYFSQPQLDDVQNHTQVLVLQNTNDVPVLAEAAGYPTTRAYDFGNDTVGEAGAFGADALDEGSAFAGDVAAAGQDYIAETVAEVPQVAEETSTAANEVEEGTRTSAGGVFGVFKAGGSWLGNTVVNGLSGGGEVASDLARGDVGAAMDAAGRTQNRQSGINAATGSDINRSGAQIADGFNQSASAMGEWAGAQSERLYERGVAAPLSHAGDIIDSGRRHGGAALGSASEHGGNVLQEIADRDRYDLGIPARVPGPLPLPPFLVPLPVPGSPLQGRDAVAAPNGHTVVSIFDGGSSRYGHGQENYIDYLESVPASDAIVQNYLDALDEAGYTGTGTTLAVDVSVPKE